MQLRNGPFDLDLVFAPDGIERFDDGWLRHNEVEGFPVCHPDDIIASKLRRIASKIARVSLACGRSAITGLPGTPAARSA